VWDGHDYVPYVWEDWLQEPHNQIFVLENSNQVVGFFCLMAFLDQTTPSTWIKGVRVAQEFRKLGLGRLILERAIAQSRAANFKLVRYATDDDNTPMHLLAERLGFRYIGLYSYLAAPALHGPLDSSILAKCRPVQMSELAAAWDFIQTCPSWTKGEGLCSVAWNWRNLELPLLQTQLEQNLVFGCFEEAKLTALAVIHQDKYDGTFFASWLDGTPSATLELSLFLQAQATVLAKVSNRYDKVLTMLLLQDEQRDQDLQHLNFEYGRGERIYELAL
jgi:GNAT superfamily N-acetyltransferase